MSDNISKSWFAVFNNPEEHGLTGTPEEICDTIMHADENVFAGGGNKTEAGRNKIVPVHPKIKPYIEKHLNDGGKTIFCKADGTPYNVKSFRDSIYYPTLEKIGVRKLTPHATRRTFATRAAAAGVRPEDLIRMMGHSDYKIDTDSYIKQEASTLVNAIQLIK